MQVYIKADTRIGGKPVFTGEVHEVNEANYHALIESKKGELYDESKHKKAKKPDPKEA